MGGQIKKKKGKNIFGRSVTITEENIHIQACQEHKTFRLLLGCKIRSNEELLSSSSSFCKLFSFCVFITESLQMR